MVNETVEKEPLETLAEKIAQCAKQADEHTITAALLMREARKRIEAGELGDVKWTEWAPKNIELSFSRLRELQRIAEAEDPQKELERLREMTRTRVEQHREKKKRSAPLRNGGSTVTVTAELEDDRKSLIEWAHSAPLDHVTQALSHVRRIYVTAAVANPDESAEPAVS